MANNTDHKRCNSIPTSNYRDMSCNSHDVDLCGSIYKHLPLEIFLEVVSHLHNYDILSLLKAWPGLRRHAILLTDHPLQPLFFDVEGVERRYLSKDAVALCDGMEWEWFDPLIHRQPIQLVELSFLCVADDLTKKGAPARDIPSDIWPLDGDSLRYVESLGKNSFVFLRDSLNYGRFVTRRIREIEMELEQTSCHWHSGTNTAFAATSLVKEMINFNEAPLLLDSESERERHLLPGRLAELSQSRGYQWSDIKDHSFVSLPPISSLVNLKTLRIETSNPIRNINLPSLEELSILIFSAPASGDPMIETASKRGEIIDLIIPSINNFVIHYDSVVPQMRNIQRSLYAIRGHLEIADTSAIQGGRKVIPGPPRGIHSDHDARHNGMNDLDLDFITYFENVSLIGVPTWLVALFKLQSVEWFRWQISGDMPSSNDMSVFPDDTILLYSARTVSIQVCVPGIILPNFQTRKLEQLNVSFFCAGGQLPGNNFWRNIYPYRHSGEHFVCIHAPKDPFDKESSTTYLGLKHEQWYELYLKFPHTYISSTNYYRDILYGGHVSWPMPRGFWLVYNRLYSDLSSS